MSNYPSVHVSIQAGEIEPANQPASDICGQMVTMGDHFYIHITPETARQWIGVLGPIAGIEARK